VAKKITPDDRRVYGLSSLEIKEVPPNRIPDEGRFIGTTTEDLLQDWEGTTVEEETV
jgi:hypothetical protein